MSCFHTFIASLLLLTAGLLPHDLSAKLYPVCWRNIDSHNAGMQVDAIATDSLGMLWVGTDRGIYNFDGVSLTFVGETDNYACAPCHAICNDGSTLYFGTCQGLLTLRDGQLQLARVALPDSVLSILPDGDRLWVGASDGLYTYGLTSGQIEKIDKVTGSVNALIKGDSGFIYPGTYNGFYRVDPQTLTVDKAFLPVDKGRSGVVVNTLLDDPARECIWLGTESTLFQFMYDGMTLYRIVELDNHAVQSLLLEPSGRLLIGTDRGLYFYTDDWDMPVARADGKNPLAIANSNIHVLKLIDGYLFAGTDKGLSQRLESENFTEISLQVDSVRADSVIHRYLDIIATHQPRQVVWDDTSATLWCGVNGGVVPVYPGKRVGTLYPFAHTDTIAPVVALECADNRLWVATPDAMFAVNITDSVSSSLDFINEDIIALSFDKATHRLLLESDDNLFVINPAIDLRPKERVYVRRVSLPDDESLFDGLAREISDLHVTCDYDSLRIAVTSLDLAPTYTPNYLYRVNKGPWHSFTAAADISDRRIPAHEATSVFVKGLRYDANLIEIAYVGCENAPETHATLSIFVERPRHATTPFYLTLTTLFITLLATLFILCRRYIRRMHK